MDIVKQLQGAHWVDASERLRLTTLAIDEIERLRKDKAELLKALTDLYEACRWEKVAPEIDAAKTAINKATGKPAAEGE